MGINSINPLVYLPNSLAVLESVGAKIRSLTQFYEFIPKVGMRQFELGKVVYADIRTEPATITIPPPP